MFSLSMIAALAPQKLNAADLTKAIYAVDLLANRYAREMPEEAKKAWQETMRPALLAWAEKEKEKS